MNYKVVVVLEACLFGISLLICPSADASAICNWSEPKESYNDNPGLTKTLIKERVPIGQNTITVKNEHPQLKSQPGRNIESDPLITGHNGCINTGVASVLFRSRDEYPASFTYCAMLPGHISIKSAYEYLSDKFSLPKNDFKITSQGANRASAGYKFTFKNRYYNSLFSINLDHKKKSASVSVNIFDATLYIKKQSECEARRNHEPVGGSFVVQERSGSPPRIESYDSIPSLDWNNLEKAITVNTLNNTYIFPVKYIDRISKSGNSLSVISLVMLFPSFEGRSKSKKDIFLSYKGIGNRIRVWLEYRAINPTDENKMREKFIWRIEDLRLSDIDQHAEREFGLDKYTNPGRDVYVSEEQLLQISCGTLSIYPSCKTYLRYNADFVARITYSKEHMREWRKIIKGAFDLIDSFSAQ